MVWSKEYINLDHGPSTNWGEDKSAGYKTRLGLWMFLVYCILYAGFIVINSVWPSLMAKKLGSSNVAVAYGMGLIVFALALAILYNHWCGRAEEMHGKSEQPADTED